MIRNLQKKDASQVALLIQQLTKNIIEPEKLVKRIERLANQSSGRFLVAELNDKIVGFAGLSWYVIPSKGMVAWVEEVVVHHQNRGQGIGRTLMGNLLIIAERKKVKQIKLMTNNPVAQNLYEKLGFIKKDNQYLFKNLP
jgi:N-acetylglutamate synthase-like GNAT family acetyltransferase